MSNNNLLKINIVIWCLIVAQYLLHSLGLTNEYFEWNFLGQFGVFGFLLFLALIPLSLFFGCWGIIAFLNSYQKNNELELNKKSIVAKILLYAFLAYLAFSFLPIIVSLF